jgi:hypothetical protein
LPGDVFSRIRKMFAEARSTDDGVISIVCPQALDSARRTTTQRMTCLI